MELLALFLTEDVRDLCFVLSPNAFRYVPLQPVEVLLSMRPNLCAGPGPDVLLDAPPILAIEVQSLNELVMLLFGPAALAACGVSHSSNTLGVSIATASVIAIVQ